MTTPLWVTVTHSIATGAGAGSFDRFTAVPEVEPRPGVHLMTHERGLLRQSAPGGAWLAERRHVAAVDGTLGADTAVAVADAFAGFLLLDLPSTPSGGVPAPGQLVLESEGRQWSFAADAAPAGAWAVLRAAQGIVTT